MIVEIWSDVVCPFCYIGKRKFEKALENFAGKQKVNITWRSFQLDPDTISEPGKSLVQTLAEKKGMSLNQTKQMMDHVVQIGQEVGLHFDFDRAVVANTFDAHRLLHLAAQKGLQDAAEEHLFRAYFTEGKDIGDKGVLQQIGASIGMRNEEVQEMLFSNAFADAVQRDQYHAQQAGVTGVPFFVFNNKYAISGAQPPSLFIQVLEKVWAEEQPVEVLEEGGFCSPEGVCQ